MVGGRDRDRTGDPLLAKHETPFHPLYPSLRTTNVSNNSGNLLLARRYPQWHEYVGFVHSLCTVTRPWRPTIRRLRTVLEEKLLGLYAHVGEFSKVLTEGGHWRVFGRRGCRYQAVHEMNLRFSIAVQGVEMNCLLVDLNTRARDEGA